MSVAEGTDDVRASSPEAPGSTGGAPGPVPTAPTPAITTSPEPSVAAQLARAALLVLSAVALSVVLQLVLIGRLQHRAAQQRAFDRLRKDLAEGVAPLGQTTASGRLLASGTPVGILNIPALHLSQVVLEGSTPAVLMSGPGHRRDTPLPGQAGTSVILGRAAAYGGPFGGLHRLKVGTTFTIVTQQGTSTFKVIDLRRAGDLVPPPLASAKGRVDLVTAEGTAFMPSGVLRVDADLVSPTRATPPRVLSSSALSHAEQPLGTDDSTLWAMVLWLEALIVVSVAAVWSWTRWGHAQTWIVFVPLTTLVGFLAAGQFTRLLPNIL